MYRDTSYQFAFERKSKGESRMRIEYVRVHGADHIIIIIKPETLFASLARQPVGIRASINVSSEQD